MSLAVLPLGTRFKVSHLVTKPGPNGPNLDILGPPVERCQITLFKTINQSQFTNLKT
jgi:hypothetical protein